MCVRVCLCYQINPINDRSLKSPLSSKKFYVLICLLLKLGLVAVLGQMHEGEKEREETVRGHCVGILGDSTNSWECCEVRQRGVLIHSFINLLLPALSCSGSPWMTRTSNWTDRRWEDDMIMSLNWDQVRKVGSNFEGQISHAHLNLTPTNDKDVSKTWLRPPTGT